jgi:hypothetical protein
LTEIRIQRAAGPGLGISRKLQRAVSSVHFKKFKELTGFIKEWATTQQFLGGYLIFLEPWLYI